MVQMISQGVFALFSLSYADCICSGLDCGCCMHVDISDFKINDMCCINITLLPDVVGLSITFQVNKTVIFNDTVDLADPDVCFGVPWLKELASLCIQFYNMDYTKTKVSGCVELEAKLLGFTIAKIQFGCFSFDIPENSNLNGKTLESMVYAEKIAFVMDGITRRLQAVQAARAVPAQNSNSNSIN